MATRNLFVNIAVKDLEKSKALFSKLGFEFNAQFTSETTASMVLSEDGYVMLLAESFFKTFTDRTPCDTKTATEALLCISAESRADVDELVNKALANGGKRAKDPQDHGFMYG